MYDAIIVGARCAGSPTAMLLARKGYRVLLVDRAIFPSDTFRNHFIHHPGVARLKRWGLLERVVASNCPAITEWLFDVGPFTLSGAPPPAEGMREAYGPRRVVLDKVLVDAAVEGGAELREGFAVQELLRDGDRVTGVRGRTGGGTLITERARLVIGADGQHSLVARAVEAPVYKARPALACWYYGYWSDVPVQRLEIYPRDYRAIFAFPTNDGLTCIAVGWPDREFTAFRANIEGNHRKTVELAPGLVERVRSGRRVERFRGTGDMTHFFRRPYGPGWALVGDAGYHKDPYLAQGIGDAFRDAELVAEAVDAGLSGRRPLQEALADYERHRNQEVSEIYEYTCQLATLEPPPPNMRQLFAALRENQEQTDRYFGTIAGTTPIREFFAPENLERVLGAAARGGMGSSS